jgi:PST family polysaccharide transporter
MKKNVFKNIIMLYGYSIAKILLPFVTVPYLARVISTDAYGVVLYVKSMGTYLQMIVDFGFMLSGTKDIVMARESMEEVGEISGDILLARLLLAAMAFAGLVVLTWTLPILRGYELYTLISFVPIFLTIFLFDYIFRGLERMQVITSRFLVMRGTAAVLTFVFVHGDADMMWIQILDIVGGVAAVTLVLVELKKLGIRVRLGSLRRAWRKLKESALYFLSNMATTAFNVLNTLLVGVYQAPSDVAYWGVCLSMVSAIQSFYSPITDGVYPDMVKTKNINQIKQMLKIFMPIVAAGCLFCWLAADYALLILGGGKYVGAAYLFRAMIPILFFSFPAMLFGWPTIGALGKTVQITATTVFSACFQIAGLLALGLSGHFTLLNLAFLRCTTELVLLLTRLFFTWRYRKEFVRAEAPPLKLFRRRHERTDG